MFILWDFKDVRRNLLTVSIITLLILLFSENIEDVSVFWIINIQSVSDIKVLVVLLVFNIYSAWRYTQFLYKNPVILDYKILFIDLVRKIQHKVFLWQIINFNTSSTNKDWTPVKLFISDKLDLYEVEEGSNHLINEKDILKEKYIVLREEKLYRLYHVNDKRYTRLYTISINKNQSLLKKIKILLTYLSFWCKDTYIFDVLLPLILFEVSILSLIIHIF